MTGTSYGGWVGSSCGIPNGRKSVALLSDAHTNGGPRLWALILNTRYVWIWYRRSRTVYVNQPGVSVSSAEVSVSSTNRKHVDSCDIRGSVHHNTNLIEITNKMQLCRTIYYSIVAWLLKHVSSDIIAHHQELLNCNYSFWFYSRLSLPTAVMAQPYILSLIIRSF
jgi:hypothetical protein